MQNVLINRRLFSSFERHVLWETDRNVEVMRIGFTKDYPDRKKVNRIIIPDQQGTSTACTVTLTGENQLVEASLHYNESIVAWFHTHTQHSFKKIIEAF